jgi:hypothetical protein
LNDQKSVKVSFVLKENKISVFFPLLQQGFQVTATVGCDIQNLLCDQFGMLPDYLSDRINTIFLNGSPVDEVTSTMVEDGATLALSASMPGLVGATFRKSGCLAAFRGSITYQNEDDAPADCHDGSITLKLFNLLVSEIGPSFLARGIWVNGRDLFDCLQPHLAEFDTIVVTIKEDNKEIDPQQITDMQWIKPDTRIFLQATCAS